MSLSPFPNNDAVTDRATGRLGAPWWRWINDLLRFVNTARTDLDSLTSVVGTTVTTLATVVTTLAGYAVAFTTGTLTAVTGTITTLTVTTLATTTASCAGLLTLTGGQIAFPATQVPSSDANTLDDYEEGTFTPVLRFGGASVGLTTSLASGTYVKVGRQVTACFRMDLTAKGSSTGAATVAGLPFAAENNSISFNGAALAGGMASLTSPVTPRVVANSTVVDLFDWGAAGVVAVDDTNFTNGTAIAVTITYLATA